VRSESLKAHQTITGTDGQLVNLASSLNMTGGVSLLEKMNRRGRNETIHQRSVGASELKIVQLSHNRAGLEMTKAPALGVSERERKKT